MSMPVMADVRGVLQDADRPLFNADIFKELGLTDAPREKKMRVFSLLANGVTKGEFVRHHSQQGLSYSLNAEFSPGRVGPKPKKPTAGSEPGLSSDQFGPTKRAGKATRAAKAANRGRKKSESPTASTESTLSASMTPLGKLSGATCESMASKAQIDAFNERHPAPPAPRAGDFDLRRRLDAIGTDIADAIADACDAQHPHALIKALVVSREAVSRAQQALPVS